MDKDLLGGKTGEKVTIVLDTKRKRIDKDVDVDCENNGLDMLTEKININGPKKGLESGPGSQGRLEQ